jgi:hypothetical protein
MTHLDGFVPKDHVSKVRKLQRPFIEQKSSFSNLKSLFWWDNRKVWFHTKQIRTLHVQEG